MPPGHPSTRTGAAGRRRWWPLAALALLLATIATALAWYGLGARTARLAAAEALACPVAAPAAGERHPGMAWIAGGSFEFGDTVYPEEQPLRRTQVEGFWISRTEVRNEEFARFVAATGYVTVAERPVDPRAHPGLPPEMRQSGAVVFVMPNAVQGRGEATQWWRYVPGASWRHPGGPGTTIAGREHFPVVQITYEDALAYARWKGHALPTEAEWEWAARSGRDAHEDPHAQPRAANTWQGLFPVANSAEDGFVGLAPAGCYAADRNGVHDLIGNAWELTGDLYQPFHGEPGGGSALPADLRAGATRQRVLKGGSFLCAPNYCMRYRAGARQPQDEDLGASHVGFRTILRAPGP